MRGRNLLESRERFNWSALYREIEAKYTPSGLCPVCGIDQETIEHLFFVCPWTRAVWFGSSLQWVVSAQGLGSFDIWLMQKIVTLQALSFDFNMDFSSLGFILWSI